MSKSKSVKLFLLLGVLAVCCAAAVWIGRREEEKELIKNSDEIILSLDAESVTALSWEYEGTSLAFHKEENWLYDEDEVFPVDEEKVADLLEQFMEFGVSFIINEVEDYGQYGLEEPTCTIHFTAADQEYEVKLGAYSTMDEQRYVSIGDGKVYLVQHDPFEDYEITLKDMIRHDEIPAIDQAAEIQFAGAEDYHIVYEEESANTCCAEDVYFTEDKPLDTTAVTEYLNTVSSLGLTEYVSYNATEEELQDFGLATPDLSIQISYAAEEEEASKSSEESKEEEASESSESSEESKEEEASKNSGNGEGEIKTVTLHVGKNQKELEEAQKSEDEDAVYNVTSYARVGDSQIVYQITSLEYKNLLTAAYNDLRHKEILTASFADIYRIDVTLEEADYIFTKTEEEDMAVWHDAEETEVDISTLQTAIKAVQADSFTKEEPDGKEEISLTVYLNYGNYEKIEIDFYRYDAENCLVVVDGEPSALVPRRSVVDVIEAVNGIVLR